MENAGRQAALVIHELFPEGPVLALIGAGNNGRDALVCLRALAAWGRQVSGLLVADRPPTDSVLHDWPLDIRECPSEGDSLTDLFASSGVVVDGVLGTGAVGPPRPRQAGVIDQLNSSECPVVSLDIPSGVDGSHGTVGGSAVRAEVTIAFGWPKLGCMLHPGRSLAGRIVSTEIGFPPRATGDWASLLTPAWAAERFPKRPSVTHKNVVGALCLVAGSNMPGAAILAARSAFRAGAGLVRVCGLSSSRDAVVAGCPEAVYVDASSTASFDEAVASSDAVAVGPGLGTDAEAIRQLTATLAVRGRRPLLLDADALTLLAGSATGGWQDVGQGPLIVTPHPGEMGRLTRMAASEVEANRVEAALEVATSHACVVVLKGTPTLVASPTGGLLIETQGSSDLAVAGMGDVLTGASGALLAQGLDLVSAAGVALHVTGRAARRAALGASLTPSDVVETMPLVLMDHSWGETDLPFPFINFDQDPAS